MSLERAQGHQERHKGPLGSARLGFDDHMALGNKASRPGRAMSVSLAGREASLSDR